MACFIVAYDLRMHDQDYPPVIEAIEKLGEAVRLQYSLFCVRTSLPIEEVYRRVRESIDDNDRLIVTETIGFLSSAQGGRFMPCP
ncbi:MAG: hypothetical protein ABS69_15425 [Nitrosomonadales bacterium SCN 54-20]|nr:MAG: hypothetical protein ABS69_15425 [Nitrosomonadales bacterium SCN 54-20]